MLKTKICFPLTGPVLRRGDIPTGSWRGRPMRSHPFVQQGTSKKKSSPFTRTAERRQAPPLQCCKSRAATARLSAFKNQIPPRCYLDHRHEQSIGLVLVPAQHSSAQRSQSVDVWRGPAEGFLGFVNLGRVFLRGRGRDEKRLEP